MINYFVRRHTQLLAKPAESKKRFKFNNFYRLGVTRSIVLKMLHTNL